MRPFKTPALGHQELADSLGHLWVLRQFFLFISDFQLFTLSQLNLFQRVIFKDSFCIFLLKNTVHTRKGASCKCAAGYNSTNRTHLCQHWVDRQFIISSPDAPPVPPSSHQGIWHSNKLKWLQPAMAPRMISQIERWTQEASHGGAYDACVIPFMQNSKADKPKEFLPEADSWRYVLRYKSFTLSIAKSTDFSPCVIYPLFFWARSDSCVPITSSRFLVQINILRFILAEFMYCDFQLISCSRIIYWYGLSGLYYHFHLFVQASIHYSVYSYPVLIITSLYYILFNTCWGTLHLIIPCFSFFLQFFLTFKFFRGTLGLQTVPQYAMKMLIGSA